MTVLIAGRGHDDGRGGNQRHSERGFALVAVMLLLVLVMGMAVALSVGGDTGLRIARNYEAHAVARSAAEAGLNHGAGVLGDWIAQWQANGFATRSAAMTFILRGPDNLIGTVASDADNGSLEALGAVAAQRIPRPPGRRTLSPAAAYEVRAFDDDDAARGVTLSAADRARIGENGQAAADANQTIVIRSIGYGPNDTVVVLEATLGFVVISPAILVNGPMELGGSSSIEGTGGGIHANGNLTLSGNASVARDATASGTYSAGGSSSVNGISGGGYQQVAAPDIRAASRMGDADWFLTNTGMMTDRNGTLVCDGRAGGCDSRGWSWTSASNTWNQGGNTVQNGTYYADGSIRMNGNVGSAAVPARISLITTGSVEIIGNPDLIADTPGLFILAEGDVRLVGNLSQYAPEAHVLVREQFEITGRVDLCGQVIVQNVPSVSTTVTANRMVGSGSITYNGSLGTPAATAVTGWRQG